MSQQQYGTIDVYSDNDVVAVRNSRVNVDVGIGQPRATGRTTYICSTYAARYNFAAKQFNGFNDGSYKDKRYMRGGRLLLLNIVAIVLFVGSIVCIVNSDQTKALVGVPLVVSIIYLLITFYNWYVYCTNGSLIHECMFQIDERYLPDSINEHFTIPLHANIQHREFIAATDGSTTAILARLRQRYQNLAEIKIMVYDYNYVKYFNFPKESLVHFLFFMGLLIGAIHQTYQNFVN